MNSLEVSMRKLWSSAILALVVLATTASYFWHDRNEYRARAEELQRRVAALEAATARDTAAVSPAPTNPSNTSASASKVTPAPVGAVAAMPAASTINPEMPDPTEDAMAFERRMLAIPEYREGRKAQRRRELARLRNEGIQVVGITPEQADKIIDGMVERSLDWSARPNPRNAEEQQARQREIEENKRNEEAELHALLGDAKAAQWSEFLASQPTRSEVRQLRDSLSDGSEPLRDDQVEPLVGALHAVRTQFMKEMDEYRESLPEDLDRQTANARYAQRYAEGMAAANKRATTEAASILSQQQLARLDAMRARQLEIQTARQRLRETQAGARNPSSAKSQ